jgi:hypothetical protein
MGERQTFCRLPVQELLQETSRLEALGANSQTVIYAKFVNAGNGRIYDFHIRHHCVSVL